MSELFKNILVVFCLALIVSCGTGPWLIRKNLYKLHTQPVLSDSSIHIRTDGAYISGPIPNKTSKRYYFMVFQDDGSVTWGACKHQGLEVSERSGFEWTAIYPYGTDQYQIKGDSVFIEVFAYNRNMMTTWKFMKKGTVTPQGELRMFVDDPYKKIDIYTFIEDTSLVKRSMKPRYLNMKWFQAQLHPSRAEQLDKP